MPTAPPRPCPAPGCPALVFGGGKCERHRKAKQRAYNERRGPSLGIGYGGLWRKVRAQVLRAEPLCRTCSAKGLVVPATDVDHIIPRSRGGSDERANLQPLCGPCHARKTATEDGGFGNALMDGGSRTSST